MLFRLTFSVVIARLDRAIQYSEASVIEPRSRGVLDTPPARGMTVVNGGGHPDFYVIARSDLSAVAQRAKAEATK